MTAEPSRSNRRDNQPIGKKQIQGKDADIRCGNLYLESANATGIIENHPAGLEGPCSYAASASVAPSPAP